MMKINYSSSSPAAVEYAVAGQFIVAAAETVAAPQTAMGLDLILVKRYLSFVSTFRKDI